MAGNLVETERWTIRVQEAAGTTGGDYFKLERKPKYCVGLFRDMKGTLDFKFQRDAERCLELLEGLELIVEGKLLEAIKDAHVIRETYFKTAPYAKERYDKTSPAARGVTGGFGVHSQGIEED